MPEPKRTYKAETLALPTLKMAPAKPVTSDPLPVAKRTLPMREHSYPTKEIIQRLIAYLQAL